MRSNLSSSAIALSLQTFASIWPIIILGLLMTFIGKLISSSPNPYSVRGLLEVGYLIIAAFAAYNCILSGGERSGLRALQPKKPAAIILFIALSTIVITAMTLSTGRSSGVDFLGAIRTLLWFVMGLIVVARFGTIFPAIVDGGDLTPRAIVSRHRTWPVVWRLIGYLVVVLASTLLIAVLAMKTRGYGGSGSLVETVVGVLAMLMYLYLATLLTALFSKAYLGRYSKNRDEIDLQDVFS